MDLKYILCDPVSKLAAKANEQVAIMHHQQNQPPSYMMDWPANPIYPTVMTKQNEWQPLPPMAMSSPKSVCSSISTCSSASSNSSNEDYLSIPSRSNSFSSLRAPHHHHHHPSEQSRRRTASDVSLTRHHMFIYSHPSRRPRSESAGNTNNVQTRTPWTPSEDYLLQKGYDEGLSWAMISSTYLPNRSRGCCWGRFKTLQNKNMVDSNHSNMRHFRRPWKAIDFSNKN